MDLTPDAIGHFWSRDLAEQDEELFSLPSLQFAERLSVEPTTGYRGLSYRNIPQFQPPAFCLYVLQRLVTTIGTACQRKHLNRAAAGTPFRKNDSSS